MRIIDVLQMHTDIVRGAVEQHTHRLLGTPHRFVLIVHLHALFLPFYLKDQKLRRTVSYFSTFCHTISVVITLIHKSLDGLVKIALQQAHFTLTIDFKLSFSLLNGLLVRDCTVSRKDVLAKA